MEVIPSVIPPGMRDQLPIIFDTMRQVFVLSLHETFYVGALICFVALGLSFLMQNPARRTVHISGSRAGSLPAPRGRRLTGFPGEENGPPWRSGSKGRMRWLPAPAAASARVSRSRWRRPEPTSGSITDQTLTARKRPPGACASSAIARSSSKRTSAIQAQVAAMFSRFDGDMGPIDILVANAGGGSTTPKPLHETSWEEWDRVLRSNLHGAFLCGREAARRMVAAGKGGRIVNISSVHEEACNVPDAWPLLRGQGRRPQSHPLHGTRARSSRHHGQRCGARDDSHADEPPSARRIPITVPAPRRRSLSAAPELPRISRPWWSSSAPIMRPTAPAGRIS